MWLEGKKEGRGGTGGMSFDVPPLPSSASANELAVFAVNTFLATNSAIAMTIRMRGTPMKIPKVVAPTDAFASAVREVASGDEVTGTDSRTPGSRVVEVGTTSIDELELVSTSAVNVEPKLVLVFVVTTVTGVSLGNTVLGRGIGSVRVAGLEVIETEPSIV
jgi:hypothetical protein